MNSDVKMDMGAEWIKEAEVDVGIEREKQSIEGNAMRSDIRENFLHDQVGARVPLITSFYNNPFIPDELGFSQKYKKLSGNHS